MPSVADDGPGEAHVVPLLVRRLGLGDDLHDLARLGVAVAVLDQQAAHHSFDVAFARFALAALLLEDDGMIGPEDKELLVVVDTPDEVCEHVQRASSKQKELAQQAG